MQVATKEEFDSLVTLVKQLQEEIKILKECSLPELLTVQQAAAYLKRDEKTVLRWARLGKLRRKKGAKKVEIYADSIREHNKKFTIA